MSKIFYDERLIQQSPEAQNFLKTKAQGIVKTLPKESTLVVGGDGTMLQAVHMFGLKKRKKLLGIHFGNKGFLLHESDIFIHTSREKFLFHEYVYPIIECKITCEKQCFRGYAFNEMQVKPAGGQIIDLFVNIDNLAHTRIRGDGVLIVTPAGSTAYNLSAGGPILPHSSSHFILTPLLAFEPRLIRPTVFENTQKIFIRNNSDREYPLSIFADGQRVCENYTGSIFIEVYKSIKTVTFLIENTMRARWDAKIFLEQGFLQLNK